MHHGKLPTPLFSFFLLPLFFSVFLHLVMTVIWGFDLSEMRWGAFGSKQMFDRRWHLRKERFIAYQIAMLTGLAAECTATYSMSKYNSHQSHINKASNGAASESNNDLVGSAISTIIFCVLVATVFGADFFFLVFWPARRYPRWFHKSRLAIAVLVLLGMIGSVLASTVVISTHSAKIVGVGSAQTLTRQFPRPPLRYRSWGQNIAWLVLLWIATLATAASTIVMFMSSRYDQTYGPGPSPIPSSNPEARIAPVPSRSSNTKLKAGTNEKHLA